MLLLALSVCAFAQDATIVGTITDPSGSVIPNVSVTVTQQETGKTTSVKTSQDGQYAIPTLQIGNYTLKADATGFGSAEKKGIVLNVGDRLRVDVAMKLGTNVESITVEENAVKVQSETGEVSDVITGKQVTQLATNGRSIYTLVNLTPGASSLQGDFQTPTPVGGDANVSFNGNRPGHNLYMLDGGENLDRGGAGTFSVMPSIDSIAEFRALTSSYSAEYGLSSAGTMTTVLKSGTNSLHASAWEFDRNDWFNARDFTHAKGTPISELRFNTYGFNVGGPVDFWKKDHKTFFFYNMEWRSLIQGGSLNQQVPFAQTYGGNFTGFVPADVKLDKSIDPNQAAIPFSGLHVPCQNQLSPAQQALFAGQTFSTPLANGSCAANSKAALNANPAVATTQPIFHAFNANTLPGVNSNAALLLAAGIFPAPNNGQQFTGGGNTPTNVREEIVRVDHQFSDKFSVFGHFIAEQINQGFLTTQWSGDNVPTIGNNFGNPSYSGVVHTTYTISPTLLNEASFNYNGNRIGIIPNGLISAPSGFNFNRIFTGPNVDNRIPSIQLSGSTGTNYTSNWTPWNNKADDYQFRDDISWTKGAHQLKFGASWALYKKIQDLFANTQGNYSFNGSFTGNDFADFLLGYGQGYNEAAVKDNGHWNNVSWASYIQDNWRVNRKLTLNLGLRWDGAPHTYEANGRLSNFDPAAYNPANAAVFDPTFSQICAGVDNPTGCTATSPGLGTSPNAILQGYQFYLNGIVVDGKTAPKGLVDNHWAAFGPRLGFAYDLTGQGKTVIRGGFGQMFERIQGNDVYNVGPNVPFSSSSSFNNVSLTDPHVNVTTGNVLVAPPLPILAASITGLDRSHYKLPVSYQYNFGVQQALNAKSVLSVAYVGNQNRNQSDLREINLPAENLLPTLTGANYNSLVPYRGFRGIHLAENVADAHYNSLQVDLHTNLRNDLQLQFGYTLSKAVDPTTGGGNGFDLDNLTNPYVGWQFDQGPSIFDRRHVAFVNFVYDVPFLKNSSNKFLKGTVGGWQVSGIITMESGAPLNITENGSKVTDVLPNSGMRPDLVAPIKYIKKYVGGKFQWFDPASFSTPAFGTFGNLPHDALRGPGRDNWNIALFKSFTFTERVRFELRAESFNTWNHLQFKGDVQNGGIGQAHGGSNFGIVTAAYDPRTMQLGGKIIF